MRFDPAHALRLAQETLDIEAQALARDIKLAHSVFALPFAILGAFATG